MAQFKTIRGQALHDWDAPIHGKICHAAFDYYRATLQTSEQDKAFVEEWGDATAFQHDLFILVEQWLESMKTSRSRY